MADDDFHALTVGSLTQPDGTTVTLEVRDLGRLAVPSGRLAACDPFVQLERPFVTPVRPGSYPVRVTLADVSEQQDGSHVREAFLSVVTGEGTVAVVEPAGSESEGAPPDGEWFVVGVDAGTVAVVDASAIGPGMPEDPGSWYDEVFDSGRADSWFASMDAEDDCPAGTANVRLPRAADGGNLVLSHSGWGDGSYPVVVTRDADGGMLGVHLDLLVVSPGATSTPPDGVSR
ncbi:DUF4241 domain-containing protein [Nocardioides sp. HDW12B]|uniref:DUF4241 domain-containing protein n=1 Tax=Nocardioides sp. HDW12B TaxID=2714939 RepID=UPI00140DF6F1|nr:DUF4241 domain-containing protein [Nocardioides sp. HDW12B]QIK66207.1 DUF4241 domain-containing protein [Nocardioides sp. HDW12B]